ncbi:MAG: glycosyltransferase [Lachnospiraceae bacterium]|nr:glycosyltransferase [Lachnospiraceae bacterium]
MEKSKELYILIEGVFDTMDLYSEEIRDELSAAGKRVQVLTVDSMDADLPEMMRLMQEEGYEPKAVITFNNLGYNLGEKQGANLWDAMGVVYINILMDHPFHYDVPLRNAPACSRVLCIDKNHVQYIKAHYPNIRETGFLAHGGCAHAILGDGGKATGDEGFASAKSPENVRDIDVLYAGSLSRVFIEQLIPDFSQFPEVDGGTFSKRCLESLIKDPSQLTEEVIERELAAELMANGNPPEEMDPQVWEDLKMDYLNGFRFLDGFAVSYYRELAVRILVENGIRVHTLGVGWDTCDWSDNENLIHLGKVSATEVFDYMKRSKVVLNTLTWFKDGAHDRIFNGLLCGAAVVSDESVYLKGLGEVPGIHLFELKHLNCLPDLVRSILSDETERRTEAAAGRAYVLHHHTWKQRLEEILRQDPVEEGTA